MLHYHNYLSKLYVSIAVVREEDCIHLTKKSLFMLLKKKYSHCYYANSNDVSR